MTRSIIIRSVRTLPLTGCIIPETFEGRQEFAACRIVHLTQGALHRKLHCASFWIPVQSNEESSPNDVSRFDGANEKLM